MSKVMTFSRVYPSYHPKAGMPTHFVEKILRSLFDAEHSKQFNLHMQILKSIGGYDITKLDLQPVELFDPKHHTIRAGHRWKVGDWFRPVVWGNDVNPKSGRSGPYHSKQITFAPDIQVKKVWDVELDGEECFWIFSDKERGPKVLHRLAKNDGLSKDDLMDWFTLSPDFKKKGEFIGQIICWNENIEY